MVTSVSNCNFHLPSSSAAPTVTPAFDAAWNDTSQADRMVLAYAGVTVDAGKENDRTPLVDKVVNVPVTTTQNILVRQYVSDPIPAQHYISPDGNGWCWFAMRVGENLATVNCTLAMVIRLTSDGVDAIRLTPSGVLTNITEMDLDTAPSSRFVLVTCPEFISRPGDRVVLEVGVKATAPTTSGTATLRFGNPIATNDFTLTNGTTTDLCPLLQFQSIYLFNGPDNNNYRTGVRAGDGFSVSGRG